MPDNIMIEVSYALPKKQIIIPILVPKDITVKEAIKLSEYFENLKKLI